MEFDENGNPVQPQQPEVEQPAEQQQKPPEPAPWEKALADITAKMSAQEQQLLAKQQQLEMENRVLFSELQRRQGGAEQPQVEEPLQLAVDPELAAPLQKLSAHYDKRLKAQEAVLQRQLQQMTAAVNAMQVNTLIPAGTPPQVAQWAQQFAAQGYNAQMAADLALGQAARQGLLNPQAQGNPAAARQAANAAPAPIQSTQAAPPAQKGQGIRYPADFDNWEPHEQVKFFAKHGLT